VVRKLDGYGGQLALVDVQGAQRQINLGMMEDQDFRPGDWVLIHMGFVVERIDAAGADKAMAGLELMGRPRESSG
jgi:hydrogenase expression/formation protein HypC